MTCPPVPWSKISTGPSFANCKKYWINTWIRVMFDTPKTSPSNIAYTLFNIKVVLNSLHCENPYYHVKHCALVELAWWNTEQSNDHIHFRPYVLKFWFTWYWTADDGNNNVFTEESVNRDRKYFSVRAWTRMWTGRHGLMASQRPILSGNPGS